MPISSFGQNEPDQPDQQKRYSISYPEGVDLAGFVDFVAKITEKNIVYEPAKLQGSVSIISRQKLPADSVFELLLSVLETRGYTLMEERIGKDETIYKVRQKGNALGKADVVSGEDLPSGQRLVSKVFQLEYADAQNTRSALENIIDRASVMAIEAVNALIVTDYAPGIRRITKIIDLMDNPLPGSEVEVMPLEHAKPEELANILNQVIPGLIQNRARRGPRKAQAQHTKVLPHPATRSLILMAKPEHLQSLKDIASRLDEKEQEGSRSLHYFHLTNVNPDKATSVLNGLFSGNDSDENDRSDSQEPKVQKLESRNILIVRSTDKKWKKDIKPLLEQVDERKKQVLISAAIVEVNSDHHTPQVKGRNLQKKYLSGKSGSPLLVTELSSLDTNFVDIDGDGHPDFYRTHVEDKGYLDLFSATRARTPLYAKLFQPDQVQNISQLPFIVTDNHRKGTLSITREYPTGQIQQKNNSDSYSFQKYVEAGVSMSFTPHISEEDYLRIQFNAEFDQFHPKERSKRAKQALQPPPRTTRNLSTSLTIPNQKTVVMGGISLQHHRGKNQKSTSLWHSSSSKNSSQRTLYVFITPYILSGDSFQTLEKHSDIYKKQAQIFLDQSGKSPKEEEDSDEGFRPLEQFEFESPYEDEEE